MTLRDSLDSTETNVLQNVESFMNSDPIIESRDNTLISVTYLGTEIPRYSQQLTRTNSINGVEESKLIGGTKRYVIVPVIAASGLIAGLLIYAGIRTWKKYDTSKLLPFDGNTSVDMSSETTAEDIINGEQMYTVDLGNSI